jgi:hypothetical protein
METPMFRDHLALTVLVLSGFVVASSSIATSPPPPPKNGIEIFNPTYRDHKVAATCGGTTAIIEWRYKGTHAELTKFALGKDVASKAELKMANALISEIDGDVFSWIECSKSGAIISFIQAQFAGTAKAKQIKLNFVDRHFSLIRKYNF